MHILVCYDVVGNRRRTRLAKALERYLTRVQKSVFQGTIDDKKLPRLKEIIDKEIDTDKDTVRIYSLCSRCCKEVQEIGARCPVDLDDREVEIV